MLDCSNKWSGPMSMRRKLYFSLESAEKRCSDTCENVKEVSKNSLLQRQITFRALLSFYCLMFEMNMAKTLGL